MSDRVDYWIEIAEYDLETARAMLQTGRLLYVGFMCHQVIEKMLKAVWADQRGQIPPYTHNLKLLAQEAGLFDEMTAEQKLLMNELLPLNVESRYPEKKDAIWKTLSQARCQRFVQDTEEFSKWIGMKLSM